MAMKLNPSTGQMMDDGLPEDPNAVPDAIPTPDDTTFKTQPGTNPGSGAPGTPDNPLVATIAPSPKPASETQTRTQFQAEGNKAREAATTVQATRALEQIAQDRAADATAAEARERAVAADARTAELEREQRRKAEADQQRNADRQKWLEGEKSLVRAEVEAQKKAANPEGDLWEGRPVARVFSTILQALGEIAAGVATPEDPNRKSRTETALDQMVAKHRDRLVKEWEATKDARQLHKENRAEWERQKDLIEVAAANQSEAQLRIIESQLEARIAKLGPEKAAAAADLLKRATAKSDAQLDLERADKFNKLTTVDETKRNFGTGGADPYAATGGLNPVLDPFTGEVIAQLPKERMAEGKESRGGQAALNALRKWNGGMKEFLAKNGPVASKWNPEARNQFDTFVTEGAGLLTVANNTGVLNDGEYGRYVKQMTPQGVLGLFTSQEGVDRGLDEIVRGAERKQVGRVQVLVPGYKAPQLAPTNAPTKGDARFSTRSDDQMKDAYKKALKAGRKDHAETFKKELQARGAFGGP